MKSASEHLALIEHLIAYQFGVINVGEPIMGIAPDERSESFEVQAYRFELLQLEQIQLATKLNALGYSSNPLNGPRLNPDYEFWVSIPFWTDEQAAALVLGRNPARGDSRNLQLLWPPHGPSTADVDNFMSALRAIKRSQLTGRLSDPAVGVSADIIFILELADHLVGPN